MELKIELINNLCSAGRTPGRPSLYLACDLNKSESLEQKVRALLAERPQHIGYEKELVAAVGACQFGSTPATEC